MNPKIINFLKRSPGYISGEEISQSLKVSRAGIWKYIQELRECGYTIEAVPHFGYRLVSVPDKIFPWEIAFDLGTRYLGKRIIYHDTVASTMDEAFKLGVQQAQEGTLVCTEGQTKGRGRMGRKWMSPKGKGIYASFLLRPELAVADVAVLTLLVAVAIGEGIRKVSAIDARIKWPNDILVGKRKLAGILTELNAEMDRIKFVVVGIGININAIALQLPPEATSLKIETGKNFSRVNIFQEVLRSLENWYEVLKKGGSAPILKRWKELSAMMGQRVRIKDLGNFIEGEAVDLADDGGLLIKKDNGEMIKRMAGDVEFLGDIAKK